MVERVERKAKAEQLLCFLCTARSASFFTLRAAEIPPGSGQVSGVVVCTPCMGRMTGNVLGDWDEQVGHGEVRR